MWHNHLTTVRLILLFEIGQRRYMELLLQLVSCAVHELTIYHAEQGSPNFVSEGHISYYTAI